MLILTRRQGETVRIGDDVAFTVPGVKKGGQVRIGVTAPRTIYVHREEIYQRIHPSPSAAAPGPTLQTRPATNASSIP